MIGLVVRLAGQLARALELKAADTIHCVILLILTSLSSSRRRRRIIGACFLKDATAADHKDHEFEV